MGKPELKIGVSWCLLVLDHLESEFKAMAKIPLSVSDAKFYTCIRKFINRRVFLWNLM